jgi:hypothetical protein
MRTFVTIGLAFLLWAGCESSDDAAADAADADAGTGDVAGDVPVDATEVEGRSGIPGWHVLAPPFLDDGPLDGMTFEWDYFSIHDAGGAFTGIVGYLIANPRRRDDLFGNMVPRGGNVALAGRWADGTMAAEYRNFGYDGFEASAEVRSFAAVDAATSEFGRMTPDAATNTLRLEGRTARFEWDLTVGDAWPALTAAGDVYVPLSADDIGALDPANERWNVDVLWPATRVTGTVTDRASGVATPVDGVGYREDSFGRWGFNLGGWDFFFLHDPTASVALVLQTYHHESTALDFVDAAFRDGGTLVTRRWMAEDGGVRWWHDAWHFDPVARQCFPRDTHLVVEDATYRLEAVADIGERVVPLLSDATAATEQYVIFELFPTVSGTITRLADDAVVATFAGQGGGELSVERAGVDSMTDAECATWGEVFAGPPGE